MSALIKEDVERIIRNMLANELKIEVSPGGHYGRNYRKIDLTLNDEIISTDYISIEDVSDSGYY